MVKEWQGKLADTVQKARMEEHDKAKQHLDRVVSEYDDRMGGLQQEIHNLNQMIE